MLESLLCWRKNLEVDKTVNLVGLISRQFESDMWWNEILEVYLQLIGISFSFGGKKFFETFDCLWIFSKLSSHAASLCQLLQLNSLKYVPYGFYHSRVLYVLVFYDQKTQSVSWSKNLILFWSIRPSYLLTVILSNY